MAIHVVRLGDPRLENEGYRFGTFRYPPRGKPALSVCDIWLPELAPSRKLLTARKSPTMTWDTFARRYRSEMDKPLGRHMIAMLVALSAEMDLSISCYCENESRCHRTILRDLLDAAGAEMG